MTNIVERFTDSYAYWRSGIFFQDLAAGTQFQYARNRFWEHVGRVTQRAARVASGLDTFTYDQWVATGRKWEQHLDRRFGRDDGYRFFTREDGPRLSDEPQKEVQV